MVQVRNGGKSSPARCLAVGEATKVASLCSFAKQPLSLKPRPARAEMRFSQFQEIGHRRVRGAIRHAGVSREVPRMARKWGLEH
jgi:hypothetical protein